MSSLSWMSLTRRVCFLCGTAVLAAGLASAQSSPSSNPFTVTSSSTNLLASGESSSNPFQLASDDLGGTPALPGASAAGGAGGGQSDRPNGKFYSPSHLAYNFGGGFNAPIGNDHPYITWGGNFTAGAGLHFSKRLAVLAEYQFIGDKLPGAFIAQCGGACGATGGNAHIWSLTLDPVIDLAPTKTNSMYVTGGGGFYRKVTSFTVQACCDFYGYTVTEVAAHFSSNQGGLNFGVGFTHRLGGTYHDSTTKLYAEARYLWVNSPRFNALTGNEPIGTTELIPVSFGVRW